MDGRANPLMDQKLVGAVFSGMAAMVAAVPSPQLLDVVWCSAAVVVIVGVVVVVWCSGVVVLSCSCHVVLLVISV